jgi:hypothetical protein
MSRLSRQWHAENKSQDDQGKQIKCMNANPGYTFMHSQFDRFPEAVRKRLSEARFNMCSACLKLEAERIAHKHGLGRPTVEIYIETIEAIEHEMEWADE